MQQGTRSSISAGGQVRYPDLELLPRLEREWEFGVGDVSSSASDMMQQQQQRVGSSAYSSGSDGRGELPRFDVVDYEGVGYGSDDGADAGGRYTGDGHAAGVLSEMYRQAMYSGGRTVSDSTEETRGGGYTRYNDNLSPVERASLSPRYKPKPKPIQTLSHDVSTSPSASSAVVNHLRRSTLDFARDIQEDEQRARQRLMDTVDGMVEY